MSHTIDRDREIYGFLRARYKDLTRGDVCPLSFAQACVVASGATPGSPSEWVKAAKLVLEEYEPGEVTMEAMDASIPNRGLDGQG